MTPDARILLGTALAGDDKRARHPVARGRLGYRWGHTVTWEQLTRHMVIIGGTGTGKTVTQMRLAAAAMALPPANPREPAPRVIYLDAKGLQDPNIETFIHRAEQTGHDAVITWPNQPIDGFSGTPDQLRQRLSQLWPPDESPFHHAETVAMLDLALKADPPPRTLEEVIYRTQPGATAAAYANLATDEAWWRQQEARRFTTTQWNSVTLRLRALAATVGNALDPGPSARTLHELDAAWISIPGTSAPQAAADIATWLLALLGELATSPDARRTLVILDEFSAIAHDGRASRAAAGLVERTRSSGMAIILGAQTTASLGEAAPRLLQTAGTVLAHRTPMPEDIVSLAGTDWHWEDTHDVDALGQRRATSGRRQQQYRVPPQLLRELPVGDAVIITAGRWTHVAVSEASPSPCNHQGPVSRN